jgi:hypothetical protein
MTIMNHCDENNVQNKENNARISGKVAFETNCLMCEPI